MIENLKNHAWRLVKRFGVQWVFNSTLLLILLRVFLLPMLGSVWSFLKRII